MLPIFLPLYASLSLPPFTLPIFFPYLPYLPTHTPYTLSLLLFSFPTPPHLLWDECRGVGVDITCPRVSQLLQVVLIHPRVLYGHKSGSKKKKNGLSHHPVFKITFFRRQYVNVPEFFLVFSIFLHVMYNTIIVVTLI